VTDGILLLDKPSGISSHSAVSAVRRALGTRKVGHAGTLDPAATGLLVMGVGTGTRLLTFLVGLDKVYEASMRLGIGTDSEDADGMVVQSPGYTGDLGEIAAAAADIFTGKILQRPSSVSAIKIDGKRSYQRVRDGEDVQLPLRQVTIFDLRVVATRPATQDGVPVVDVDVVTRVSSGTYVRALARDLGQRLGSAGHLVALRRTAVGPFDISAANLMEDLSTKTELMTLGHVAAQVLPTVAISGGEVSAVQHGQRLTVAPSRLNDETPTALMNHDQLLAVANRQGGRWNYLFVVAH